MKILKYINFSSIKKETVASKDVVFKTGILLRIMPNRLLSMCYLITYI